MALEMKVHGEIRAYEAKVIGGLSWRQLLCMVAGVPLLIGTSTLLWFHAREAIVYVDFIIMFPFAAWGWWRPKELKPEKFLPYIYQYLAGRKVLRYEFHARTGQQQAGRQQRKRVHRVVRDLERGADPR